MTGILRFAFLLSKCYSPTQHWTYGILLQWKMMRTDKSVQFECNTVFNKVMLCA